MSRPIVVDVALRTDVGLLAGGASIAPGGYAARATWPSGFTMYESGARADGVFVVLRGCVVLRSKLKAGRGFVPGIAVEGETFGGEGLEPRGRYVTDARAEGETETLHFSENNFRAYLREQPQHALALLGQIMAERSVLLQKMYELSTLGVEQRLLLALLRLARSRIYTADTNYLVLQAPHYRLLCELVGATRESVSLVLNRLSKDGLVSRDGSCFRIGPISELGERIKAPVAPEKVGTIPSGVE